MKELIKVHFDELLVSVLFVIIVGVWIWKPDAKEWATGLLGALIMALKNKYTPAQGEVQTQTKTISNVSTEPSKG